VIHRYLTYIIILYQKRDAVTMTFVPKRGKIVKADSIIFVAWHEEHRKRFYSLNIAKTQ